MSFRCPSQTGLTEKDLVPYTGAGILSAADSTARDGQGMITPTAVASTLTTLRNTGVLPNIAGMTSENYSSKQRDFLTNVKKEYCYYESRYKYALDGLFSAIRDNYGRWRKRNILRTKGSLTRSTVRKTRTALFVIPD